MFSNVVFPPRPKFTLLLNYTNSLNVEGASTTNVFGVVALDYIWTLLKKSVSLLKLVYEYTVNMSAGT